MVRTALESMIRAGVTLVEMVGNVSKNVADGFRQGFFEGLLAIGLVPLDLLIAAAGFAAAAMAIGFTMLLEIFDGYRGITPAERTEAKRVFGRSIDLDRVKIACANLAADFINWINGERPFTTMYLINFSSGTTVTPRTLIHELTHVWQGVTAGPIYMAQALHSQVFGRGYEVTDADLASADGDILNLEREQQAVVVERYWVGQWGSGAFDWEKYSPLARQVHSDWSGALPRAASR